MDTVLVAGLHHETNTFSPHLTDMTHFLRGGGGPPLATGEAVREAVRGANLSLAGFMARAERDGLGLLPSLWACAGPSGPVTRAAYEELTGIILADARRHAGRYQAVCLDLHGAMVTGTLEDGEGELLARLRRITGPEMPVFVTLDFHANLSEAMFRHADLLLACRTYPHTDMAETGERAALLLSRWRRGGKAFRRLPFLLPLSVQSTLDPPMGELFHQAAVLEQEAGIQAFSIAAGFPASDIHDAGPWVFACAGDGQLASGCADRLHALFLAREDRFTVTRLSPEEATAQAMRESVAGRGPVILADIQDNPGAGGSSDTTGLLRALAGAGAPAVLGVMVDPAAAMAAHQAGENAVLALALGGKGHPGGSPPLCADWRVRRNATGRFLCRGPFYRGLAADLGPMTLLELGETRVVVASAPIQAADREIFRHLGVHPEQERILGLKSTVHFRADFGPIAARILLVEAPGLYCDRPGSLDYRRLRGGLRLL